MLVITEINSNAVELTVQTKVEDLITV